MDKAWKILEIDQIIDEVAKYTKTISGKDFLYSLRTYKDKEKVVLELNKLRELILITDSLNDLPLIGTLNISEMFNLIDKGEILDEIKLNNLKEELFNVKDLIKYFGKVNFKINYLTNLITSLKSNESLYEQINHDITQDNRVSDNASSELSSLRRKIARLNDEIHKKLRQLIVHYKDQLLGDNFVLRDGYYALPVNTSLKTSVKGIVRDISDSGLTTFIEPIEIIELENEKHLCELKERNEINRILRNLTNIVIENKEILLRNNRIIGELDFIDSKAKYAKQIDGIIPEILNNQKVVLYQARHPLLDKKAVVANDFVMNGKETLMLISGPNAGGKTIALKTIATLCYMVKLGFPIPAAENSAIGFFNHIYVDIGDDQSIESNLSTFSAHINNFSVIFKYLTSRDLVVLDEVGEGTDPKEGEALSIAVTKYLLNKKCLSLITSHYDLLKKFGLVNDNIISASFVFNEKRIEPTYRLITGIGGKSYGFLIAKKYGLKEEIINDAINTYNKNYLTKEEIKLRNIENKEIALKNKEEALKNKEIQLNDRENKIEENEKDIDIRKEKLRNKQLDDLEGYLDKKYDEIEDIYNEFLKTNNEKAAIQKLEKLQDFKKETIKKEIKLGDYVYVKLMDLKGKVVEKNNNKISILTDSGFSLKTTVDKAEITNKPSTPLRSTRNIDKEILNQKIISSELNLIGYHIEEAIPTLDSYLNNAMLTKLKIVKVIHGYGTGRLRIAIHDYLKKCDLVASFRLGNEIDGGSGSTIITLK